MISVAQIYEDVLKSSIIQSILKEGRIPSVDEINAAVSEITKDNDLNHPLTKYSDYELNGDPDSSASWIQNLSESFHRDLRTAYESIASTSLDASTNFDATYKILANLRSQLLERYEELSSRLLFIPDYGGFKNSVGDTFKDLNKVDLESTSAEVDVGIEAVHCGHKFDVSKITLNRFFPPTGTKYNALTINRKNFAAISNSPNMPLKNILTDVDSVWHTQVKMTSSKDPVVMHMIIEFPQATTLSKIGFTAHQSMGGGLHTVGLQISEDGINWKHPCTDWVRHIDSKVGWVFTQQAVKAVRLIMTKYSHDFQDSQSYFVYEFGGKLIEFYKTSFVSGESIFLSKPLMKLDAEEVPVLFNKLALTTCEAVPDGTGIKYSIALGYLDLDGITIFEKDSETNELLFHPIEPLNHKEPVDPYTLTVNEDTKQSHRDIFAQDSIRGFEYADFSNVKILDRVLGPNSIESKLIVLRNISGFAKPYYIVGPWGYPAPRGWWFDGEYYYCYMNVDSPGGLDLDFGPSSIYIDGTPYNDRTHIAVGLHQIKIHYSNWYDIDNSSPGSTYPSNPLGQVTLFDTTTKTFKGTGIYNKGEIIDGIEPAENYDPLYPYNHKLLVNGLYFSDQMPKDQIQLVSYPDARFIVIAATKMNFTSPFDLAENAQFGGPLEKGDFQYYSIVDVDSSLASNSRPGLTRGIMVVQPTLHPYSYKGGIEYVGNTEGSADLQSPEDGEIGMDEEYIIVESIRDIEKDCSEIIIETYANIIYSDYGERINVLEEYEREDLSDGVELRTEVI